jgi:hypothetical protein
MPNAGHKRRAVWDSGEKKSELGCADRILPIDVKFMIIRKFSLSDTISVLR